MGRKNLLTLQKTNIITKKIQLEANQLLINNQLCASFYKYIKALQIKYTVKNLSIFDIKLTIKLVSFNLAKLFLRVINQSLFFKS